MSRFRCFLAFSLLCLTFPPAVKAQSTRLVRDICAKPSSQAHSFPRWTAWFQGWWYFAATDGTHGRELWRSRGTAASTEIFYEFQPGPSGGSISRLTPCGALLFFVGKKAGSPETLWVTDGSRKGTHQVKTSGRLPLRPRRLFAWRGKLYFAACTSREGEELWVSDGTSAGTKLLKDIRPGAAGSALEGFTPFGGRLFFKADDGIHGKELWKTDGTTAGTTLFSDLFPGASSGVGRGRLVPAGGVLFFPGVDKKHGEELWKTDGTSNGTVLVKDVVKGVGGCRPLECGKELKGVLIYTCNDGVHGEELWQSDGTPGGTRMIEEICEGRFGSAPREFTYLDEGIFLSAVARRTGPLKDVRELWRLVPGRHPGEFEVKKWMRGGMVRWIAGIERVGNPTGPGSIVFTAQDYRKETGVELWKANSKSSYYTRLLVDIRPGKDSSFPSEYCSNGKGTVLFSALTDSEGIEPWRTDGTKEGTSLVADIFTPPLPTFGSIPSQLADVHGTLYFSANDGIHGRELWKSDGTEAGTVLVKDIRKNTKTGVQGTYMTCFTPLGGLLLFRCDDGKHGRELWKSDGTEAGTVLVKDIRPGSDSRGRPLSSEPLGSAAELGGILLFSAAGPEGRELWRTDGTEAGTSLVKDIRPGPAGSAPSFLVRAGRRVFFSCNDGKGGGELWVTDGTAAGTRMVKDIRPGPAGSSPAWLVELGGKVFFIADDGVHGEEIWVSDGTEKGTRLVLDVNPGKAKGAWNLYRAGDFLYFAGNDGVHGREVWRSDGSSKGTVLVKDVNPGGGWSGPDLFTPLGNICVFRCNGGGGSDFELWRTDGTAEGTFLVKDIRPGKKGSFPWNFARVGSRFVYFSADDGIHGRELWRTDGTAAGTFLVKDVLPGEASSYCSKVALCRGVLFFRAADVLHGQELWLSDPGATTQTFGEGSLLSRGEPALEGTDPVLGGWMEIRERSFPSGLPAIYVLGLPAAAPRRLFPGFPVHLDLSSPWIGFPSSGKGWIRVPVPADPLLAGRPLLLQAWLWGAGPAVSRGLLVKPGL